MVPSSLSGHDLAHARQPTHFSSTMKLAPTRLSIAIALTGQEK
jgi:hypothetical protein